jgi:hypothetical protein
MVQLHSKQQLIIGIKIYDFIKVRERIEKTVEWFKENYPYIRK